jgi:hypothetical protein
MKIVGKKDQFTVVCCGLWVVGYLLSVVGCLLSVVGFLTSNFGLRTSDAINTSFNHSFIQPPSQPPSVQSLNLPMAYRAVLHSSTCAFRLMLIPTGAESHLPSLVFRK